MKIVDINKKIFREYDVRGIYSENLNEDVAYTFGKSYGSYIKKMGHSICVVGRDNRYSSDELKNGLVTGILETGVDVIDIGLCTTPMYYYACITLDINRGVMVTASHNPKDDNGFKFSFDNNQNAKGKEIEDFFDFCCEKNYEEGKGTLTYQDIKESYLNYLIKDLNINSDLNVVIDCGNATTSFFAPELYGKVTNNLTVIYGKSDPSFPNHHPDPSVKENMIMLSKMVKEIKADIGIAFDGDGDRVGFVDDTGRILDADQFMAIIVKYLSKVNDNKKYLYDVKCGNTLIDAINEVNGTGFMVRTGNSYTKLLTKENDCVFGGEYSGHVYFRDKFFGFDSGMYAGLRMLELLSSEKKKLSSLVNELNKYFSSDENKIKVTDENKFEIVKRIKEEYKNRNIKIDETDGVRISFDNGWGLVRASNTGPNLTVRAEANNEDKMNEILNEIIDLINKYI